MADTTHHPANHLQSMTARPAVSRPRPTIANAKLLDRFALLAMWLLPIMAFTQPTVKSVSGWQALDMAKLVILAIVCFGGAYALFKNFGHPKFRRVIDPLIPFYGYFAWALFTVFWTPLRSVTIFQAGGLAASLFFATALGVVCTDKNNVSRFLWHLNLSLLVSSGFVLFVYLINPTASGLDRIRIHTGGEGLIHPTAAGATASLGLLLPVLCHVFGKFVWAKKFLVPAIFIHGAVVFFSNSRTATGMALLTIGFVMLWYSNNRQRAIAMTLMGLIAFAGLVVDPGFLVWKKGVGASASYVSRGQSSQQLAEASGRSEVWTAVWNDFEKAMVLGHGYAVTSEQGELYVWGHWHNFDAHNLILQVLSTTGTIGLILFLIALAQPSLAIFSLRVGNPFQRNVFVLMAVVGVWYVGWSQLSVSFMGPVRPESLVFYAMLGVGIGQSTQMRLRVMPAMAGAED